MRQEYSGRQCTIIYNNDDDDDNNNNNNNNSNKHTGLLHQTQKKTAINAGPVEKIRIKKNKLQKIK